MSEMPTPAMLAAIASPRRREILRLVWQQELSAGDIARAMPDVTFGAVSLQLRALKQANLVAVRIEDRHRFYRAQTHTLGPVAAMLEQMWDDALWSLKLAAELEESRRGPRPERKRSTSKRSTNKWSSTEHSSAERSSIKRTSAKRTPSKRKPQ